MLAVHAGKPEKTEKYDAYEADGITVYVAKADEIKGVLNIEIGGFGPFKHFVVKNY